MSYYAATPKSRDAELSEPMTRHEITPSDDDTRHFTPSR